MGVALFALTALCPIAHADEAKTTGQGGWLGVSVRRLSEDWREREGYSAPGVLVVGIVPGSPADQVGIAPGDVLVSIGERSLNEPGDLAEAESLMEPGHPVSAVVARNGGRMIKIFGGVAPDQPRRPEEAGPLPTPRGDETGAPVGELGTVPVPVPTPVETQRPGASGLGVRCENLNPDLAAALDAPDGRGVLVLQVQKGSLADRVGIRPGDVITRLGGQAVEEVLGLDRAIAVAPSPISIMTLRRGAEREVVANLDGRAAPERGGEAARAVEPRRDQLLLQLRDEVRKLREEVQKLREEFEAQNRE